MSDTYDPSATSLLGSLFQPLDYPRRALWRGVTGLAEGDLKAAAPLGMGALTGVLAMLSRNPYVAAAALPLGLATGGSAYGLGESMDPGTFYDPGEDSSMLTKTLGDPMTYLGLGGVSKGVQGAEKLAARLKAGTLAATEIPEGLGNVGRVPRDMLPWLKNAASAGEAAPELGAAERAVSMIPGASLESGGVAPRVSQRVRMKLAQARQELAPEVDALKQGLLPGGEEVSALPQEAQAALQAPEAATMPEDAGPQLFAQRGPDRLHLLMTRAVEDAKARGMVPVKPGPAASDAMDRLRQLASQAQQGQQPSLSDPAVAGLQELFGAQGRPAAGWLRFPGVPGGSSATPDLASVGGLSQSTPTPPQLEKMLRAAQEVAPATEGLSAAESGPPQRLQQMLEERLAGVPSETSALPAEPDFAGSVMGGLASVGPEGRFRGNKVFIHRLYESLQTEGKIPAQMTLEEFKGLLHQGAIQGKIPLERADLVQAMNPADVAASESFRFPGSRTGEAHFVLDEPLRSPVAPSEVPTQTVPRGPSPRDFASAGEIPEPAQPSRKIVVRNAQAKSLLDRTLFILREPNDTTQAVNAVLKVVSKIQPSPTQSAALVEAAQEGIGRLNASNRDKNMALLKIKRALNTGPVG